MSDFNGLRIALSSLYAQRKALQVTGQNIANVNTDGYSRQRVDTTRLRDLPAAAVDLQLQEVAYQAALGATARALQPTLMDFLR